MVDEFQDTNFVQYELIKHLSSYHKNVFCVGDPDQSIYGFQAASPELFRELAKRDDVEVLKLEVNYRSGANLIAAANTALGETRRYVSNKGDSGTITVHHRPAGLEDQAQFIARELIPDIVRRLGLDLSNIAILYRDKSVGTTIARHIKEAGLEFMRIDGGSPIQSTPLIDLKPMAF